MLAAGVLSPDEFVMLRFTVKVPADVYVCVAFRAVLDVVLNQLESPNDQFQYCTFVVCVVSLNWTAKGTKPDVVLLVKDGIGSGAEILT